jgi:hypothetical protein
MIKSFLNVIPLLFCVLSACNSQKSGENDQTADTVVTSQTNDTTSAEKGKAMRKDEREEAVNFSGEESRQNTVSDLIQVENPLPNDDVQSPLTVKGQARGTWYFEAEFQVFLKDKNNNILAQSQAVAQGPWMTRDFVPFEATLRFDPPDDAQGTLVLQKANPSGKPEHDSTYVIPINF